MRKAEARTSTVEIDRFLSSRPADEAAGIRNWLNNFRLLRIADMAIGRPNPDGKIPFIVSVAWEPAVILSAQCTLRIFGYIEGRSINNGSPSAATPLQVEGRVWDDSSVSGSDRNSQGFSQRYTVYP